MQMEQAQGGALHGPETHQRHRQQGDGQTGKCGEIPMQSGMWFADGAPTTLPAPDQHGQRRCTGECECHVAGGDQVQRAGQAEDQDNATEPGGQWRSLQPARRAAATAGKNGNEVGHCRQNQRQDAQRKGDMGDRLWRPERKDRQPRCRCHHGNGIDGKQRQHGHGGPGPIS